MLSIYQSEPDQTYVTYTGNGVSGDASSFLNVNINYAGLGSPSSGTGTVTSTWQLVSPLDPLRRKL